MNANDTAFAQTVKDLLAEINAAGDWAKPWNVRLPRNLAGRLYSGSNVATLFLAMRQNDWSSPFFGTFKQALDLKARVKKGSKAKAKIIFAKTYTKEVDQEEKTLFAFKEYAVFNAEQLEDAEKFQDSYRLEVDTLTELALELYAALGVRYRFNNGESAHYQVSSHSIELPDMNLFKSSSHYLATAIHELIHWTAKDLVQRPMVGGFGSREYAHEELIAEFSTLMLLSELGVGQTGQKAYLKSWLAKFEEAEQETVLAEVLRTSGHVVVSVLEAFEASQFTERLAA